MTAVVGILNKEAVAIAADSAVTISNDRGRKTLNRANKIFTLSKVHPVGVMLYNSASFMGTPWEIIIKMYRRELKEKSFGTVRDYQEDFIRFLKDLPLFANEESQKRSLAQFCFNSLDLLNSLVFTENHELQSLPSADSRNLFLRKLEEKLDQVINQLRNHGIIYPELSDYTRDSFERIALESFAFALDAIYTRNNLAISDGLRDKLMEVLFLAFKNRENNTPYTGLIFTGYGEYEIYPTLNCLNVTFAVGSHLRYYQQNGFTVSEEQPSAIFPYAQTDVIDTILRGSDPNLWRTFTGNFGMFIRKYNELILNIVGDTNQDVAQRIREINVDHLVREYVGFMEQVSQQYVINPMMMAVSTLSKEDLVEMAESLIYLTYLKRRFTFAEESVGGPVDVAVISKGDGFIWMKRKHYFKPDLNAHFFNNYFK